MPSLFRFLAVIATLGAVAAGSLYVLAEFFEPQAQEVSQPVPGVKVRRQ